MPVKVRETRKRSIIKAITYRILVSILAFIIAYHITGTVQDSIKVMVYYLGGSVLVYYIHERIWAKIPYGVEIIDERGRDKHKKRGL